MEAIIHSAEYHFLVLLNRLKAAPQGWAFLRCSMSKRLKHEEVLRNPAAVKKYIGTLRQQVEADFAHLQESGASLVKATAYLFDDHDIVVLMSIQSPEAKSAFQQLYKTMQERVGAAFCEYALLEGELYNLQKYADEKLLSAKRMFAYREVSDRHKIASIPLRRERREHPLVQVVEDDRFTASYTANILNREFDMVLSRNGESAILDYVENAPDIIFIDIHLPGIDGHAVLQALKIADPKVFAVMLSVDTVKDNIVKSAEGGAYNFLKKPFSKERLLNIVKSSPHIQEMTRRNSH
ncbi:MAG: response regulator [Alphaproteobacteria bacterium]